MFAINAWLSIEQTHDDVPWRQQEIRGKKDTEKKKPKGESRERERETEKGEKSFREGNRVGSADKPMPFSSSKWRLFP